MAGIRIKPHLGPTPPVVQSPPGLSVVVGAEATGIQVTVINRTDEDTSVTVTVMPADAFIKAGSESPPSHPVYVVASSSSSTFFGLKPGVYNVFLELDGDEYGVRNDVVVGG
jgi:hypothetical protein